MPERLLILLAVGLVVAAVSLLVRRAVSRRVAGTHGQDLPSELRRRFAPGTSGIVYFFGPACASCNQQARVLDRLEEELGHPIVRLDAVREADVSRALSILSVPATVVVGPDQTVRSVNLGYRGESVLRRQLQQ